MRRLVRTLLVLLLPASVVAAQPPAEQDEPAPGWPTFNGNLEAQKYSPAAQITPHNVGRLKVAWQIHTGDLSHGGGIPETDFEATPIFANDTVYIGTPFYRIFALAPDSGAVKWIFDPHAALKPLTQTQLKSRGVAYWQSADPKPGAACQKIVYIGTMDSKLYAVDADNGRPCTGFGKGGVLDVNQWNTRPNKWPLSLLQPPTVYRNTLFLGWAGKDWHDAEAPLGTVFALDAETGALKWQFDPLSPEERAHSGTADVWASMSVDPERGILYLPVSSPSPNFYGGMRKQPLPYGTSVTALDAESGRVIWNRQLVHHDIWDYDPNSAPTLIDIRKDGKVIPALVQSTKQGFLFVLNRLTGAPIYPIEERPVPKSDVPGERSAPTQPVVPVPQPTVPARWPGISILADIAGAGSCSRQFHRLRYDGRFTPPSLGGSLIYPATPGGVEWGGGAVDVASRTYVVNSSYTAQIYRLLPRAVYDAVTRGKTRDGYYPMNGSPYGFYLHNFTNWLGMPCWAPPYGSISTYDLDSGRLLWKEPFGQVQKWGLSMPESWGSVTIGGPLVTASGLIFIGASMDSRVRALDIGTGKVLWKAQVDAPAVSIPATYMYKGRQYVVFTAGGNTLLVPRISDQVIAFALK